MRRQRVGRVAHTPSPIAQTISKRRERCPRCHHLTEPIPKDRFPPFCLECCAEFVHAPLRERINMLTGKPNGAPVPFFAPLPCDPNRYPILEGLDEEA